MASQGTCELQFAPKLGEPSWKIKNRLLSVTEERKNETFSESYRIPKVFSKAHNAV
jgi:hypothetical protein